MPSGKTERYANVGVAILAKAPLAGFAKTRLIPHLGAEGAAAIAALAVAAHRERLR